MSDWPQEKPPPYPADDEDDATPYESALEAMNSIAPPDVPPPDVWEFYRRHGRWPNPDEA
jgi:hypothetical protein